MVNTNKWADLPVNVFHNFAVQLKNLFSYIPLYYHITMANKWADLPVDILIRILKHGLDLKTDLTRLRGVCSTWRSALPLEEHLTYTSHIQVPSLPVGMDRRPLFLLETAFYFFSPLNRPSEGSSNSSGWVARLYQIAPNKWRLLNPLSYDCRFELTDGNEYVFTDPPIVGKINLLDCRVFMFSKALILVDDLDLNAKPISTKVVGQWDLTSSTRPLSAILVLLDPDHVAGLSSRLLLLRQNDAQNQEIEWSEINVSAKEDRNRHNFIVHEIAYNNKTFFVFQVSGDRWRLGTINPTNEILVLKPFASGGIKMPFSNIALVPTKSNNDGLYLLVSPESGDIQCHFFGDEFKRKNMKNFIDEMLFWLNYVSFSFPTSTLDSNDPFLGKKSSAICQMFSKDALLNDFTIDDYYFDTYVWPKGMEFKYPLYKENISLWVLKIKKDIYDEPCILDFDNENQYTVLYFKLMPEKAREVYKRLFFPPPTWVKWRCPSLHHFEIKLDELPDYAHEDDYFWYNSDF